MPGWFQGETISQKIEEQMGVEHINPVRVDSVISGRKGERFILEDNKIQRSVLLFSKGERDLSMFIPLQRSQWRKMEERKGGGKRVQSNQWRAQPASLCQAVFLPHEKTEQ